MPADAHALSRQLASCAHAVCAHYLSQGRKQGRYWVAGDVDNHKGHSLFVRLHGTDSGPGAAGKWTDAATGQYGDLLDLITLRMGYHRLSDTLAEARRFLALPAPLPTVCEPSHNSSHVANRLYRASKSITGTLAQTYLARRGLRFAQPPPWLRYHPTCNYRADDDAPLEQWPALIAGVTDLSGNLTGIHRTWIARDGKDKAPLAEPRRALGRLLGHAVRFHPADEILIVTEGVETALSIRAALATVPLVAALSAAHLAAMILSPTLKRLYIASDNDPDGHSAADRLSARAQEANVAAFRLLSHHKDWNDDLLAFGVVTVRAAVLAQMTCEDAMRFAVQPDIGRDESIESLRAG